MKTRPPDDRVGDLLEEMGTITREDLAEAVAKQRAGDPRPLGVLLIELGHASPHDIEIALIRQQARRGELKHDEGMRVLEEAHAQTRATGSSFDELAQVASALGKGDHR